MPKSTKGRAPRPPCRPDLPDRLHWIETTVEMLERCMPPLIRERERLTKRLMKGGAGPSRQIQGRLDECHRHIQHYEETNRRLWEEVWSCLPGLAPLLRFRPYQFGATSCRTAVSGGVCRSEELQGHISRAELRETLNAWTQIASAAGCAWARLVRPAESEQMKGKWSRPMPLTDLSDRIFKNPRQCRKLRNIYGSRLRRMGRKSWQMRLDGLPENIQQEIERP